MTIYTTIFVPFSCQLLFQVLFGGGPSTGPLFLLRTCVCVYPADVCYDDDRRQYVKNRFNLKPARTQVSPPLRAYFPLFFFSTAENFSAHTDTHHSFNCFFCAQLNFPQKHHSLFPEETFGRAGKFTGIFGGKFYF